MLGWIKRMAALRPNAETWKPIGNTDGGDDNARWEAAANLLGISIKIGYPVPPRPGNATAEQCHRMGMYGVYIHVNDVHRKDELQRAKWDIELGKS